MAFQARQTRFNVPRHDFSAFTRGAHAKAKSTANAASTLASGVVEYGKQRDQQKELMKFAEGERKSTVALAESLEEYLPEKSQESIDKLIEQMSTASPQEAIAISGGVKDLLKETLKAGTEAREQKLFMDQVKGQNEALIAPFLQNTQSGNGSVMDFATGELTVPQGTPGQEAAGAIAQQAAAMDPVARNAFLQQTTNQQSATPLGKQVKLPEAMEKSGFVGIQVSPNSIAIKKAETGEDIGWMFGSVEEAKEFATKNGVRGDIKKSKNGGVVLSRTKMGSGFDPLSLLFGDQATATPSAGGVSSEEIEGLF